MTLTNEKSRPAGAAFGEHCLNSTVAVIRAMYGPRLIQRPEIVPTRYCAEGVRVNRYWLVPGASHG